jgi:hypothetical protein
MRKRGNKKVVSLSHEDICCPNCGRMMTAVLAKDAGWLEFTDSGRADGNEVLAYSCMRDDCLEGQYQKAA